MRTKVADIVLMPYNYLSDARIRKALGINITKDVLIIDEAHNIPQVIEESSSFTLDETTFARILKEIELILSKTEGEKKVKNGYKLLPVKILAECFHKYLKNFVMDATI